MTKMIAFIDLMKKYCTAAPPRLRPLANQAHESEVKRKTIKMKAPLAFAKASLALPYKARA